MSRSSSRNHDSNVSRGIIVVLLLTLTTIITLSFFNKAGALGIMINEYILSFLFGSMRFITPFVIVSFAWIVAKDDERFVRPTHLIGAALLLFTACSLLHLSFETNNMWQEALNGKGGGVFGMLAWPLKSYLGVLASMVVLIGLVLVSLFLILNSAFFHLLKIPLKIASGVNNIGKNIAANAKINLGNRPTPALQVHGEYQEKESTSTSPRTNSQTAKLSESTEDEPVAEKRFMAHKVGAQQDDEDSEETEEEIKMPAETPWSKKVIIKDLPPLTLLSDKRGKPTSGDIKANAQTIQSTLHEFGIDVEMGEVRVGPAVTQYSLKPDKGVKLSRIIGLSNDLALALAAHPIRIEAPIPGKALVGIEVPNQKTALVSIKELLESKEYSERPHPFMIALGKDVGGKAWFADLPRMPHLLVAGATGSGKTVCMNTIILSLLYQNTAESLRFIMVDPKRVELTLYNGIPHLLTPVITNVQKTVNALKWTIGEMERRFEVLEGVGCRDLNSYNERHPDHKMPHIVFVIDELADLMAAAANEVEAGIIRLAQMARAVGINLVVATQRPSVDVITGLMKANIPGRIAFSVASIIDSRTILDCPGAEKLLGRGDMLLLTAELSKPVRLQGAFASEEEVKDVVEYLRGDEEPEYDQSIVEKTNSANGAGGNTTNMFGGSNDGQDALFEDAKIEVLRAGKASASLLQRRLKIGYARAARVLDELEAAGVIGPGDGAKPREILVTSESSNDTMDSGGELNAFKTIDEPVEEEVDPITKNEEENVV